MLALLKKNRARRQTARFLYGSIVTAARQRLFYAGWGVPDTMQGRFELILVHMVLAQHRLLAEGDDGARLARALSEAFIVDMDDQMREMTFGDLSVPREIRFVTAALFDRWRAYGVARAEGLTGGSDGPLREALATRFAYLEPERRIDSGSLAGYMRRAAAVIGAQPPNEVLAGQLRWPTLPGGAPVTEEPRS